MTKPEKITDFRREGAKMPHDLPTISMEERAARIERARARG